MAPSSRRRYRGPALLYCVSISFLFFVSSSYPRLSAPRSAHVAQRRPECCTIINGLPLAPPRPPKTATQAP